MPARLRSSETGFVEGKWGGYRGFIVLADRAVRPSSPAGQFSHVFDRICVWPPLNEHLSEKGRLLRNSGTRPSPDRYERNLLSGISRDSLALIQLDVILDHRFDAEFGCDSARRCLA